MVDDDDEEDAGDSEEEVVGAGSLLGVAVVGIATQFACPVSPFVHSFAAHIMHDDLAYFGWNVFTAHSEHCVAPGVVPTVPGSHALQDGDPAAGLT